MSGINEQVDEFKPATEPITTPAQPAQPAAPIVTPAAPATPATPEPAQPAAPEPVQPAAPEPVQPTNARYDSIIQQQTEQINALIAQNQSLTDQMTKLIQNGAQIGQPQQVTPLQQFAPPALSDNDDWSLEALGREMAKDRR